VKRDQAIGRLEREGETNEVLEKEVGAIAGEEKRIIEVLEGIRQDVKTREEEVRLAWRGEKALGGDRKRRYLLNFYASMTRRRHLNFYTTIIPSATHFARRHLN
jgi:hypothetical protein